MSVVDHDSTDVQLHRCEELNLCRFFLAVRPPVGSPSCVGEFVGASSRLLRSRLSRGGAGTTPRPCLLLAPRRVHKDRRIQAVPQSRLDSTTSMCMS